MLVFETLLRILRQNGEGKKALVVNSVITGWSQEIVIVSPVR